MGAPVVAYFNVIYFIQSFFNRGAFQASISFTIITQRQIIQLDNSTGTFTLSKHISTPPHHHIDSQHRIFSTPSLQGSESGFRCSMTITDQGLGEAAAQHSIANTNRQ
jgi:hypothetical protein